MSLRTKKKDTNPAEEIVKTSTRVATDAVEAC